MNIPMRWGREATRFVVGIKNRGRFSRGYGPGGSPLFWENIARWSKRRSQKHRRNAKRRAA